MSDGPGCSGGGDEFWERPEEVERFADRDPDHRLVALAPSFSDPPSTRVLDLGCAGGRNTVFLAERGFDVFAVDASASMVTRTRGRVAVILGDAEAKRRVTTGLMQDLGAFDDASFDLLVALGIFHQARSGSVAIQAFDEAARVLKRDGLLLVASLSPHAQPHGTPLVPVAQEPHLYTGYREWPLYMLTAEELDGTMRARGLVPAEPTETVRRPIDHGLRVTVNALYRKTGPTV